MRLPSILRRTARWLLRLGILGGLVALGWFLHTWLNPVLQMEQPRPVETLEWAGPGSTEPVRGLIPYRELLRAYIIMGSGHLGIELRDLADVFATAGLSPKEVLHLHLYVAAELIRGLGSRSTRHVITRTNLLIMEVLLQLAEAYRSRYRDASRPPIQLFFPQFEQCLRDIAANQLR